MAHRGDSLNDIFENDVLVRGVLTASNIFGNVIYTNLISQPHLYFSYPLQLSGVDISSHNRDLNSVTISNGMGYGSLNSKATELNSFDNITISGIFAFNDPTQNGSDAFKISSSATNFWKCGINDANYSVGTYDTFKVLIVKNNSVYLNWESTATYNTTEKNHFVVVAGTDGLRVYINGVQDTGTFLTGNSSTPAGFSTISGSTSCNVGSAKALANNFKLFNRILCDEQILAQYDRDLISSQPKEIVRVSGIGLNANTTNTYFINAISTIGTLYTSIRGLAQYTITNNEATNYPGGNIINIDGDDYRLQYNGWRGVKVSFLVDPYTPANIPAEFRVSTVYDDDFTMNSIAVKGYANNNGNPGNEYAFYSEKGDFYAPTNYGFAGLLKPPTYTDANAPNNSVYYSSTQSKLVYKDAGGTSNALY